MTDTNPTGNPPEVNFSQEDIDAMYAFASAQLANGVPFLEIERALQSHGLDPESAATIVSDVSKEVSRPQPDHAPDNSSAHSNMLIGGLVCGIGTLITVGTYSAASSSGGGYTIAWGAILFGGIQFLQGLGQLASK